MVMTFHPQICTKKSSKWNRYSKLCVVGILIRKYILKWICVYRINFSIRNFRIQANYTAKVKVVGESPRSVIVVKSNVFVVSLTLLSLYFREVDHETASYLFPLLLINVSCHVTLAHFNNFSHLCLFCS